MNDVPPLLTLYAPLAGATFDSEGAALVGGTVIASIPYEDEWRNIQKTDVMLEQFYGSSRPPVCLTVLESRSADEHLQSGIERAGARMLQQVRDAVMVLRLYKDGWFLDPELAQTCFAIAARGWQLQRRPGPYRQAFLYGISNVPCAPYSLRESDLTVSLERPGPTTVLWNELTLFRERSGNASTEIALENFSHSHAFQLADQDRLASLFMALDTMLGGMSAVRLAEVVLHKGRFRKRVEAALSMFQTDVIDAPHEAAWLDGRSGARALRNAIAHGGRLGDVPVGSVQRLQRIVRLLLRQYMRFAVHWAENQSGISTRFRLPQPCSLAAAYNKVLEARGAESDAAVDLLS